MEAFLPLLTGHGIQFLVDVRRFPSSRRYPHFGKEALERSLEEHQIGYMHFPELGGKRLPRPDSPNSAWQNQQFRGYADYMESPEFQRAIEHLVNFAKRERTAIMCAEALWWQCHRGLVADYLKANGATVLHILSATKTEAHPYTKPARIIDGKLSYAPAEQPLDPQLALIDAKDGR